MAANAKPILPCGAGVTSYPNLVQKSLLHVVQDGVVFYDSKILRLSLELLVRVDTRPEHLRSLWLHAAHLLRHLVRGCGDRSAWIFGCRECRGHAHRYHFLVGN